MKNIFTFALIIMVCMVNSAKAQSSAIGEVPSLGTPISSIVRSYNVSDIITYELCQNDVSSFSHTQIPFGTLKRADTLLVPIKINDFREYTGWVFFCGEYTPLKKGVIGYFYISDFFSNTFYATFYYYVFNEIETFYRLTVVNSSPYDSSPRIVAIGREVSPTGQFRNDIIFECEDILQGTPIFKIKKSFRTANEWEEFCDICSTNNHIVVVGSFYDKATGESNLCLRRCDLYNPMYGQIDDLYLFPETNFVARPELFAVNLGVENDEIAISYRGETPSSQHYYRLRIFDNAPTSITNINSQEMYTPDKAYMHEMTYLYADRSLVQLIDFSSTGGFTSNFVYLDPYAQTGYTSKFVYDGNCKMYQSVTTTYLGSVFVGAGGLRWLFRDKLAPLPAPSLTPPPVECPFSETVKIGIIDNLMPNVKTNPETPIQLYSTRQNGYPLSFDQLISIICESE